MENSIIIVRYNEIALKSPRVRSRFEQILARNVRSMLEQCGIEHGGVTRERGRLFIKTGNRHAAMAASRVFGVVSTSPAAVCGGALSDAAATASLIAQTVIKNGESFAIRPHRAGVHEFTSRDIGIACGKAVQDATGAKVDLDNPDREIFVEMRQDKGYVFTDIVKGVGGLPLGSQGRMVALISGGIDSPVAAWMMMKRGCEIIPVYFNNDPFADETTRTRAMECISVLQGWAPGRAFTVYEVPHGNDLLAFLESGERRLTCVFCRRMMYRIAAEIAKKEGAYGLVTGASLGQVASQTSGNMLAEMHGIDYPIYHPLIGLDKSEITDIARKIGTFEPSTKPATCCAAVPELPSTEAAVEDVLECERKIDVPGLVTAALDGAVVMAAPEVTINLLTKAS